MDQAAKTQQRKNCTAMLCASMYSLNYTSIDVVHIRIAKIH